MDKRESIISTVDVVLMCLRAGRLHVGMLRRTKDPFGGQWALPGGYIRPEEDHDARAAAMRVLRSKMGVENVYLEQLQTFSGAARDPRGWSLSVAYFALVLEAEIKVSEDVEFGWFDVKDLAEWTLPFDHRDIVQAGLSRLKGKAAYSSMPCYLLESEFTLTELQDVYVALLGNSMKDKSSFRRKLGITAKGISEDSFLEPVPGAFRGGRSRPAQLYRLKDWERLALRRRGF